MGSIGPETPGTAQPVDPPPTDRGGWPLALLLVATFAIRAIHPGQPIVENYIGRQIPTAMVARNLERDGEFLRPKLDTGPFPNLFLVEPPIYAGVVLAVRPILGFDRDSSGRLVSAAATALAAWGLFGLARRREGRAVALLALGSFCCFPVMIRYGRAFQPDALMVGFVLSGLRGWDEFEATGDRRWAAFGGFVLSMGLALKITAAWALIPFVLIVRRWPIGGRLVAGLAMMVPALAWYLHAWNEVAQSASLASSDNAAIWLGSLGPGGWVRFVTWSNIGWGLVVRSFTPVGFVLSTFGLVVRPRLDRVWVGWGVGCGLAVLGMAPKWHHAYYWMVAAPLAAVGMARGLRWIWDRGSCGRIAASTLGSCFLAACVAQSASTWRTPDDWQGVVEAAREVDAIVPDGTALLAPEALLYLADRPGYRLEFAPPAVRRAIGELGSRADEPVGPLTLVDRHIALSEAARTIPSGEYDSPVIMYHYNPAPRFVVDAGPAPKGSRRADWRRAIRDDPRLKVRVDRPGLLIAELP